MLVAPVIDVSRDLGFGQGHSGFTDHVFEAVVRSYGLSMITSPSLKCLCQIDDLLSLLAELVQRLHAALRDHYTSVSRRYFCNAPR